MSNFFSLCFITCSPLLFLTTVLLIYADKLDSASFHLQLQLHFLVCASIFFQHCCHSSVWNRHSCSKHGGPGSPCDASSPAVTVTANGQQGWPGHRGAAATSLSPSPAPLGAHTVWGMLTCGDFSSPIKAHLADATTHTISSSV